MIISLSVPLQATKRRELIYLVTRPEHHFYCYFTLRFPSIFFFATIAAVFGIWQCLVWNMQVEEGKKKENTFHKSTDVSNEFASVTLVTFSVLRFL